MTLLWNQARQETALPDRIELVCNIGCHHDLWNGLGDAFFDDIRTTQNNVAVSAWPGGQSELREWMSSGLIDVSIGFHLSEASNLRFYPLKQDRLILVSTDKDSPIRFDPNYIFVEAGDEFGRQHAADYADANTAKLSFGSARWGLDYILKNGGSTYLSERLVQDHLLDGRLVKLEGAPVYDRNVYLTVSERVASQWDWLEPMIKGY
jgi:DNA-binding transcriptional LysR family regulator